MIPNNLPYRKLPRDKIDTENLTWFDYIIGRFSGEMWWERDDINASGIDPMHYYTIPFPEETNTLHLWFFGRLLETEYRTNIPWLPSGHQSVEGFYFYPDTQCRFDIWTLYNHPPEEVNLETGGTVKIETLPKQEDVENVLPLRETVPSDVPLIFGPRIYASESSIPHRPFVQNNSQISNITDMARRRQEHIQKMREKEKRQQRQDAQWQKEKRQKWKKAQRQQREKEKRQRKKRQQRQYAQSQKEKRSRRQERRSRRVPQTSSEKLTKYLYKN